MRMRLTVKLVLPVCVQPLAHVLYDLLPPRFVQHGVEQFHLIERLVLAAHGLVEDLGELAGRAHVQGAVGHVKGEGYFPHAS